MDYPAYHEVCLHVQGRNPTAPNDSDTQFSVRVNRFLSLIVHEIIRPQGKSLFGFWDDSMIPFETEKANFRLLRFFPLLFRA